MKLELDIDLRMHDVIMEAVSSFENDDLSSGEFVAFLRAAYGMGYVDALKEDKNGQRGKLGTDNGYKLDI